MAGYRAKPPKGATLNRSDPLAKGLAAAHLLNERGGLTAYDLARGKAGDAAISGATWGRGAHGPALTFVAASSQYAESSYTTSSAAVTLAALFRTTNSAAQAIAAVCDGAGSARWQLSINAGVVSASSIDAAGTSNASASGGGYTDGLWHLAVGVFAGASLRTLWIDGVAQAPDTNARTVSGVTKLALGTRYSAGARGAFFDGQLGGVWFWDRALPAAAVRALWPDPFRLARRRPVPVPLSVQAASFNPAWARGSNAILGGAF